MDNIILFLALFSLTATAVQVSLFRHWWQQLALALVIAAITYCFYPTAIAYSTTDIEQLLANTNSMLDMSVVLVLEAVVMLILALFMLRDMYTRLVMPYKLIPHMQFIPMVSAVGVLCFYQVHLYQQALEWEFATTAFIYGGSVALTVVLFAWVIKFLVPARVLRLELKLAMHAAQIVLAVAVSILTARHPYLQSDINPNINEFIVVTIIISLGAVVGYVRYQYQSKKLLKKR
ncbi:hypothetical protein RGQ13_18810 [Thalassotalea psychrophila]|uniref:Uncharacterized protein n=1 Tax=Thalassotalea psychrophila TaxID=3065647 RepID=A0ABY9TUZ0_9GAMM|nr:hypothetical protein RGQ13_18810 [Colwelliaceae bacterium SQ149]